MRIERGVESPARIVLEQHAPADAREIVAVVGIFDARPQMRRVGSDRLVPFPQDEAVDALADVVSIAKARLNDPDRPLAAFLFVGPTGVGKTESAKAMARTTLDLLEDPALLASVKSEFAQG